MGRFINFEELLKHPEYSSINSFVMEMYESIPFEDDSDYLQFRRSLRHILEILEKDNGSL